MKKSKQTIFLEKPKTTTRRRRGLFASQAKSKASGGWSGQKSGFQQSQTQSWIKKRELSST